ncbi:hypothetical protein PQ610_02195 [Tardisphaera miroshnichenkoae]
MSYGSLDEKIRALIGGIESAKEFDLKSIGESCGLGDEVLLLYRNYVAAKGLVAHASVNFFRIGLEDTWIIVRAKYPLMRTLNDAFENLLSTPGSYLVGLGSALAQSVFITRHLIPNAQRKKYINVIEELTQKGIFESYEVIKASEPRQSYSLDPAVFDYATGNWKQGVYSFKVKREVKRTSTDTVSFDEVDLKILTMLRRSAMTTPEAMAAATGLSVDEALTHLREHVLGGGDPRKSMITNYRVDFMEPGLFAPDTMIMNVIAQSTDGSDELVERLASIPYFFGIWRGEEGIVHGTLYGPLQGLYAITHEIGSIGNELHLKDLRGYVAPWYYWNILGSLHSPASLDRNFRDGKWVSESDRIADFIESRAKAVMREP